MNNDSLKRVYCWLPKDMKPSKEAFEKLGFFFIKEEEEELLYLSILPKGWRVEKNKNTSYIFDENGKKKVECFYQSPVYTEEAYMTLISD